MRRWWLAGAACTLMLAGAPAIAGSQALAATAHGARDGLDGAAQTGQTPVSASSFDIGISHCGQSIAMRSTSSRTVPIVRQ